MGFSYKIDLALVSKMKYIGKLDQYDWMLTMMGNNFSTFFREGDNLHEISNPIFWEK